MSQIVIVDLGMGNLRSVSKAVETVADQAHISVTNSPELIGNADYLILPGQGAIGTWMTQLQSNNRLSQAVSKRLKNGPVLGICLGLQAMFEYSEENEGVEGLGLLNGTVKHFSGHSAHRSSPNQPVNFKVPHMGWNEVRQTQPHPLWNGIKNNERFYFVHSYYVESTNPDEVMGQCEYGNCFTAAAAANNLFATQFHPEKSQHMGLQLLKNFVNWNGSF